MPNHGDGKAMAERLGAPQDSVSRWASGARKPPPEVRALIQDKLGISWRAWDEPPPPTSAERPPAEQHPEGDAA